MVQKDLNGAEGQNGTEGLERHRRARMAQSNLNGAEGRAKTQQKGLNGCKMSGIGSPCVSLSCVRPRPGLDVGDQTGWMRDDRTGWTSEWTRVNGCRLR